ncbi:TPA: hypothetical protein N0F65_005967 [Lagenidium giganteum]|uniref:Ion transport domain-containing protein n=1 Tax=Lagenidium giganteum TaxID=4803 RepID=A0AAV2ZAL0_9STRA|nr:TPA: hypothetical protein N0F65_005967 [Lagenidium giganteum]
MASSSSDLRSARDASRVSCGEYFITVASRLYFSNFYRTIYIFNVMASIFCMAWVSALPGHCRKWFESVRIVIAEHFVIRADGELFDSPSSVTFIALEIVVSGLLVLEVLLRIVAFKKRFWSRWSNVFDIVALVMSLMSVALYFNEEGVLGELEEVASDGILALRNSIQYFRLAVFLKNRNEKVGENIDIDFGMLDQMEEKEAMLSDNTTLAPKEEQISQ